MKKRIFIPARGVSNIELFYDLIFVYCISVISSLLRNPAGGFPDRGSFVIYAFSFIAVLQVWFYTTLLMNRYGDGKALDNICLFVNMFLLYYLAKGIRLDWESTLVTFNASWALVLLNLMVHWVVKRLRYSNLDDADKRIMHRNIIVLGLQFLIVVAAALLPARQSEVASWVALLFGMVMWGQAKVCRCKPPRFEHLSERCSLLVIVMFGETLVTISSYMKFDGLFYPLLVFALVVGLFLIYIFEHDNMLDHHNTKTDGMAYMTITSWFVFILGNLTVALGYMPDTDVSFVPKSVYLTAFLVLYLLTTFTLGRYNKPEFHYTPPFIAGRVGAAVAIVLVAAVTKLDPVIAIVFDIVIVYASLAHEWFLFHSRSALMSLGRALGFESEELAAAGYTFQTHEGRRAIQNAIGSAMREAHFRLYPTKESVERAVALARDEQAAEKVAALVRDKEPGEKEDAGKGPVAAGADDTAK